MTRLLFPLLALTACGTHVPDNPLDGAAYKDLDWTSDYEGALQAGLDANRPVYLVLAAGPVSGFT